MWGRSLPKCQVAFIKYMEKKRVFLCEGSLMICVVQAAVPNPELPSFLCWESLFLRLVFDAAPDSAPVIRSPSLRYTSRPIRPGVLTELINKQSREYLGETFRATLLRTWEDFGCKSHSIMLLFCPLLCAGMFWGRGWHPGTQPAESRVVNLSMLVVRAERGGLLGILRLVLFFTHQGFVRCRFFSVVPQSASADDSG